MNKLINNYKIKDKKDLIFSIIVSVIFLTLSLIINYYAGLYTNTVASNSVTDVFLNNFPVYDVDTVFIYGSIFLVVFIAICILINPRKIPFSLKTISLFVLMRSIFISLTHIAPFPERISITSNIISAGLINKFSFGSDLFFSGHTGLPFLMALIFWNNKFLRYIFLFLTLSFAVIVLLGHIHYSIDVFSAFFITYGVYRLSEIFFKKDFDYFISQIKL